MMNFIICILFDSIIGCFSFGCEVMFIISQIDRLIESTVYIEASVPFLFPCGDT